MAKVNYRIKSSVTGQPATIYVRYSSGRGNEAETRSLFTMNPEYWSNATQSVKQRILYTEAFSEQDKVKLEADLQKLRDYILKESLSLKGDKPTKEWLNEVITRFNEKPKIKAAPESLRQYLRRFYDEAKTGTRLANAGNTKRRYSYESLRSIKGTVLSFEMFMDAKKRKSNWNDITIDWYNDFLAYYYSRGCGANYIGKHIKNLKTIMRVAREEGLHDNAEIERKSFKVLSEPSDNIYLTENEVAAMYNKDLSDSPILAKVRDIFLVGCYTAQRYSDYSRINKTMIKEEDGVRYIDLIQQKTGERCLIPMRPELETILQRYDYTLPKSYEQKVNDNIKKVGEKCGIKEPITVEQWKSGMKVKTTTAKFKLIKTHTARRTGCTLMYIAGVRPIDIMKISGHKTEMEFLKYIKVGKKETAMNLALHPYFIGNNLSIAQ